MKFDHIGLVTNDIREGRDFLSSAFGVCSWSKEFNDPGIRVTVQFGISESGPCFELISPLGVESPVSAALKSGKNILNHIAYLVDDLDDAALNMRAHGCLPVSEAQPAVAYNRSRVQFFISPLKFMIELIEAPHHEHDYKGIL